MSTTEAAPTQETPVIRGKRVPDGWRLVYAGGQFRACCFVNSKPLCRQPFTSSIRAQNPEIKTCKPCEEANDGFWAIRPGDREPQAALMEGSRDGARDGGDL